MAVGNFRPGYKFEEEIQFGTTEKIYLSRTIDEFPLLDIRVTEGEGVCKSNNQSNISINRTDY